MIADPLISYFLMGAIFLVSVVAWQDQSRLGALLAHPYSTWRRGQWYRLLTSGFVHSNWSHLLLNLFVLFFFAPELEYTLINFYGSTLGSGLLLALFLVSVVIGDLPDLFIHKDNPSYRALGASGGVSGILFAFILLWPTQNICLYVILCIPGVLFGVAYLAYSWYMARQGRDNIGHLAHFAGAVAGLLFLIILRPVTALEFVQQIADWQPF